MNRTTEGREGQTDEVVYPSATICSRGAALPRGFVPRQTTRTVTVPLSASIDGDRPRGISVGARLDKAQRSRVH